jgi:serine/threonine protein kinase
MYIGFYKLNTTQQLGEGSFSTVYLATSSRPPYQTVAIKIDKNPDINSLKHEATILSYLNYHLPSEQCIPTLYWYGVFGKRGCIVTPIYKALTIDFLNPVEVINILQKIHKLNIVHCDIKPDNFMLTQNTNQLVLIDYGLAYNKTRTINTETTLRGSPRYASYFVYLGQQPQPRDDLISAGYVFMEQIYGMPFETVVECPDYTYELTSIHHINNVKRKHQRTLEALLSCNLPKHLCLYFEHLYKENLQIDYQYLQSLFQ